MFVCLLLDNIAFATPLLIVAFLALITLNPAQAAHHQPQSTQAKGTNAHSMKNEYEVLDVQGVTIAEPTKAVKTFVIDKPSQTIRCDVLIAGGGVGAVAAAAKLSSQHPHLKVCLTEETDWLGGQMTAQGVSALDENYLIETSGACRSYQELRTNIRNIYKQFKLSKIGQAQEYLHPGSSWVTYLSFEPKFALQAFELNLNSAISSGALQIFLRTRIVQIKTGKSPAKSVEQVLAVNLENGDSIAFEPKICLDATELGDLLPLAGLPYRIGSDSRSTTGEAHAPLEGDKENVQDIVYPFVVDFKPGTNNTIEKPAQFEKFNDAGKFSFDGYKMFESTILKDEGNREVMPFWTYRRLVAKENFDDPLYPFDVSMINWDSNDLRGYNIVDQKNATEADRLALAKSLSLGFLYWLQTQAPRDDGGKGYPELELRKNVLGTADGLSKYPYIREARRVIAKKTIVESDIVSLANPNARAKKFDDTVGIGLYPVDIHGKQEVPGAGQSTKPFQIPMSALVPVNGGNLLPACKNIGVTHITNGAYRLHPVEWAIGEAQAEVAAYCIDHHMTPEKALSDSKHRRSIQRSLIRGGSPVMWFDDVPTTHPDFQAIQYTTLTGIVPVADDNLHFLPDAPVSQFVAVMSLYNVLKEQHDHKLDTISGDQSEMNFESTLKAVQKLGYLRSLETEQTGESESESKSKSKKESASARPLSRQELQEIARTMRVPFELEAEGTNGTTSVSRAQFARFAYAAGEKTLEKIRH